MRYCLCALAWVAAGLAAVASAAEDRSRAEAEEADRRCEAELPRWHLTADGAALDTPKKSIQRWTNVFAGRVYGNTYVWLRGGRPAAASTLMRYFEPYRTLDGELVMLAGSKLVARRDGREVWHPKDEWEWHSVPGAAAPAATAPLRLVQMRTLAEGFEVQLLDTRIVPKGEDQTPRLLPRPLYRYEAERTKTLDGALYAFALGTDPELLLLLECDTDAAKPGWRFGVGRMCAEFTRLKYKGKVVWEASATQGNNSEDPYMYLHNLWLPGRDPNP